MTWPSSRRDIQGLGVVEELGVAQPRWQGFDAIVLSPGVPPELPWLMAARTAGLPVVGELEVAAPFIRRPLLAVSGTNGKTTTTTLLGELLTASGIKTLVGGNIGTPVVSLLGRAGGGGLIGAGGEQLPTGHRLPTSIPRPRRCSTSPRTTWTAIPIMTPISPPRPACSGARGPAI